MSLSNLRTVDRTPAASPAPALRQSGTFYVLGNPSGGCFLPRDSWVCLLSVLVALCPADGEWYCQARQGKQRSYDVPPGAAPGDAE